jgi:hypothetical protein
MELLGFEREQDFAMWDGAFDFVAQSQGDQPNSKDL